MPCADLEVQQIKFKTLLPFIKKNTLFLLLNILDPLVYAGCSVECLETFMSTAQYFLRFRLELSSNLTFLKDAQN